MNWLRTSTSSDSIFERPSGADAGIQRCGDSALVRTGRRAMATQFEIILPFNSRNAADASIAALDLIDGLEDQLSAFRPHSELVQLNHRAFQNEVGIETRLFDLLRLAAGITRETQGAFDVAAGALSKAWGFYQRSGRVPSVPERAAAMAQTGMRYVILNEESQSVRYLRKGLEINLGGIGKGYALDRAGQALRELGVSAGLIHGGMSSVLAMGAPAEEPRGWMVSLRHPWTEGRSLGSVYLRDRALGTSAATYQFFEYNGRKLGHILDPRKGWPAEGLQQVTVIAHTAAEADALSTAFYVMGLDAATEYCRTHPQVAAIILPTNEAAPVVLNLSPGDFSPNLPNQAPL
jgi:thiamine biosynthesis lipoprotein